MKPLFFLSILFTGLAMSAGLAHLYALPNKIDLPRADYLTVQQVYRGWALLGIAVIGALLSTTILAIVVRGRRTMFLLTAAAAVCIAVSLLVFFLFTFPANQATVNWTVLPANWEELRRSWEYSHAVGAILYVTALILLTLALLHELDGGYKMPPSGDRA